MMQLQSIEIDNSDINPPEKLFLDGGNLLFWVVMRVEWGNSFRRKEQSVQGPKASQIQSMCRTERLEEVLLSSLAMLIH